MLVDSSINLYSSGPRPATFYSYESADPVEELSFMVDGIPMSNFVYPAYFEAFHKPDQIQFDHMNKVSRPFEILPGGYQQLYHHGRWTNHTVADEASAGCKRSTVPSQRTPEATRRASPVKSHRNCEARAEVWTVVTELSATPASYRWLLAPVSLIIRSRSAVSNVGTMTASRPDACHFWVNPLTPNDDWMARR